MCGGRASVISGLDIQLALYDGGVEGVRFICLMPWLSLESSRNKK
jgi:hypothetical protein